MLGSTLILLPLGIALRIALTVIRPNCVLRKKRFSKRKR
jgi:hypothetical protein